MLFVAGYPRFLLGLARPLYGTKNLGWRSLPYAKLTWFELEGHRHDPLYPNLLAVDSTANFVGETKGMLVQSVGHARFVLAFLNVKTEAQIDMRDRPSQ